jgi:hypothetical protein
VGGVAEGEGGPLVESSKGRRGRGRSVGRLSSSWRGACDMAG